MPEEEAMDQAVKDMGDASALGVMLNQTHQVRVPSMFVLAVILAVLAGLAGNFLEYCSRKYCSQPGQWGEQFILAAGMSCIFLSVLSSSGLLSGRAIHGLYGSAAYFLREQGAAW